jgi:rod shape-determining protein MreB
VERRAIRESALGAGASEVYLIEEPMAAAIGAGLPVRGLRLDGGGHRRRHHRGGRDLAGRHGLQGLVRVGGDKFDEAIINYIRRNYGMLIGEPTAEPSRRDRLAFPGSEVKRWKSRAATCPKACRAASPSPQRDPRSADRPAQPDRLRREERAGADPPELGADIAERGMMLTGGGALLRDLDRLLAEETGLPVLVAEDPLTCVVRGCGMALERMDRLGSIFTSE